jgi:agmatinase
MSDHQFAFLTSTTNPGFLNAPPIDSRPDADFVVAGVAWDGATTNRPGARFGPYQIRRASHMLGDAWHPLFEVTPAERIADVGDIALPNTSLSAMRAVLEPAAAALIARKHVVWLGGDHSITLPLLRAYRKRYGRALALVHFDAHCDTWPDHAGEPSGHGTWVREAVDEGLIDPRLTVQFGLRSPAHAQILEYISARGGLIYSGRGLRGLASPEQLRGICAGVRARLTTIPELPVYLSLDIDCLDPAYAPGTGTPEPGGLSTAQVMTLLEELHNLNWIGMDLCEVAPPYDHSDLTSNAAATLIWTYLCGRIASSASGRTERTARTPLAACQETSG